VVDHYRLTARSQEILNAGGLRWMQFGNRLHTHPLLGDMVHDASPGADAAHYAARLSRPETRFLAGPAYALVDESFASQRARLAPPGPRPVDAILLTFGGGDDRGATLAALDWLDAAGFAGRRLVLTTGLNPSLPALRERAGRSPRIDLHVDNWHPAPLMAQCQLAICAGGTSLYELACLGVPPLIVCIAENQLASASGWDAAGLGCSLGALSALDSVSAAMRIKRTLSDDALRHRMATKCWENVDGLGVMRTVEALMTLTDIRR
jgi:spore coat polysaccharide biosynthesis predicted glycosyltransferase SpsG